MTKNAMPVSKAKTAYGLLSEIRKLIIEEPKRYDQNSWSTSVFVNPDALPACGTVCCVAGWVKTLKDTANPTAAGMRVGEIAGDILGLDHKQRYELFRHNAVSHTRCARQARRGSHRQISEAARQAVEGEEGLAMSYGSQTRNPIEHDESPMDDERTFPCACGDDSCVGHYSDAANIRLGNAWYAADCEMANNHPEVVRSRELDAIWDRSRR